MPGAIEKNLYSYYNEAYEEHNPDWHRRDTEWKFEHIKPMVEKLGPFKNVVDIGTGTGTILKRISQEFRVEEAAGVDISQPILKQAKNHAPEFSFIQAESSSLPFETKYFDLSLLIDVLEHSPYPLLTLQEAKRVSEYVFIKVPLEVSLKNSIKKKLFKVSWEEEFGHLHKYSEKRFLESLLESGLQAVASQTVKAPLALYENPSALRKFLIVLFNSIDGIFRLKRYPFNESNLFILCRSEEP